MTKTLHYSCRYGYFGGTARSFFSSNANLSKKSNLAASLYPLGVNITLDYIAKHKTSIQSAKEQLQCQLDTEKSPNLSQFVDVIFDYTRFSALLRKIDLQAHTRLTQQYPTLLQHYHAVAAHVAHSSLAIYLEDAFLPALRWLIQDLATYYRFDPHFIESIRGILMDDDFMEYIDRGKLVFDLGEDGHGPLPHVIAAFMMAELQSEGSILSAVGLYQSLSQQSHHVYCPERTNFRYYFSLLLDSSHPHGMFSNPSNFSNYILLQEQGTLSMLTRICKRHATLLSDIAHKQWVSLGCQQQHVAGRVMESIATLKI